MGDTKNNRNLKGHTPIKKDIFQIVFVFVFLQLASAIISGNLFLFITVSISSLIQGCGCVIKMVNKELKPWQIYKFFGIAGMYNSFVFLIIATYMLSDKRIGRIITIVVLVIIDIITILIVKLVIKRKSKVSTKVTRVITNKDKLIIGIVIIVGLLAKKYLDINLHVIIGLLLSFLSICLCFLYGCILKARELKRESIGQQ